MEYNYGYMLILQLKLYINSGRNTSIILETLPFGVVIVAKNRHASVRIEDKIYEPLRQEAEEKCEGNVSLLIRHILKTHIESREGAKEYMAVK